MAASFRIRYFTAAAVLAVAAAPTAQACVTMPLDYGDGKPPTAAQLKAEEKRWMAGETKRRTKELKARNSKGEVDVAAELATLLVPNVRAELVLYSDCGPMGDYDLAGGSEGGDVDIAFARMVAGTPLEGRRADNYPARLLRELSWPARTGETCNAEFRRRFARYLGDNMFLGSLQEAWLFLSARQRSGYLFAHYYPRLMAFEGIGRVPPMRWTFATPELQKEGMDFLDRKVAGKALTKTIDAFWAEQGPNLADDAAICPEDAAAAMGDRDKIIAALTAYDAERQAKRQAAKEKAEQEKTGAQ